MLNRLNGYLFVLFPTNTFRANFVRNSILAMLDAPTSKGPPPEMVNYAAELYGKATDSDVPPPYKSHALDAEVIANLKKEMLRMERDIRAGARGEL